MGGCRCTYRSCNVKSDGKTHMFHYPVFDKVRCHQWLVNAQRLEFLDLKVSQLKNRCVCQHHFKTENFMNFKKDKLTFDAVPTIDGPFCDPSKEDNKKYPNPILIEDIENDFDINDKKSNFSLKYAHFLTNNEFVDSSARYNRSNVNVKDIAEININYNSNVKNRTLNNTKVELPIRKITKIAPQQRIIVPCYSDLSNEVKMGQELNLEPLSGLQSNVNHQDNSKLEIFGGSSSGNSINTVLKSNQDLSDELKIGLELNLERNLNDALPKLNLQNQNYKLQNVSANMSVKSTDLAETSKQRENISTKSNKVKIISEKKIKDPIHIGSYTGNFQKISPSCPLSLPDKSRLIKKEEPEIKPNTIQIEIDNKPSEKLKVLEILNVDFVPSMQKSILSDQTTSTLDKIEDIAESPPKKTTHLKNKVTAERIADIEKKRQFNLKLKDIIESCLDKLDDPLKNYEIISSSPKTNFEKPLQNNAKLSVEHKTKKPSVKLNAHHTEEKHLSSIQDNTIAYLEERMKKMESTLLNKIAQNSQQISDFKKTYQARKMRKEQIRKRNIPTQTNESESSYKKFLYNEISKYLSPNSSSIIYEELFINKYLCDKVESPTKRKRRRCI